MPAITDLPIWQDKRIVIISQGTATTTQTTYTYNGTMDKYMFRNDGGSSITLTVNAVPITVTAGESVSGGNLSSFAVTASSGTIPYTIRAYDATQTVATIKSSGGTEIGINNVGTLGDGVALSTQGFTEAAIQYGWNGSTYDRIRVPNVYKYISFAALGATTGAAAWTPATGKKFRLMGCTLQSSVAAAIMLKDGTSGTIFQLFYPNANEAFYVNLQNGYLSTAANNVMEVYNSGASSATVRLSFFGTEE